MKPEGASSVSAHSQLEDMAEHAQIIEQLNGHSRMSPDTMPLRGFPSATSAAEVDFNPDAFASLQYMTGFGNQFQSEALPGALPVGRNSPQVCPYGLYAEQVSGTAFTAPRKENQRSWLYRIRPSVTHTPFSPAPHLNPKIASDFADSKVAVVDPNQMRWLPMGIPRTSTTFIEGLETVCGTGSPELKSGFAVHMYVATTSMVNCAFANADGDLLIVPQQGRLWLTTEFGRMEVKPGEIAVVQQGIRFAVGVPDGPSRGYVCEVFGGHFQLPELGPIGANGLANPRDFEVPVAWYDDREREGFSVVHKFDGRLFSATQSFSPFNVVAWHGNYVPFKYDLSRFCPMNSVSFDHPDPSIFTVLTCPSQRPGVAMVDFVVFPPRWSVSEGTFRPPYFHRNCMSEFMGLIRGMYEAKADGFLPGGCSLHNTMTPHGPDTVTFENATRSSSAPQKLSDDALAFMFESAFTPRVTMRALQSPYRDLDYYKCWQGLRSHFTMSAK